MSPHQAAPAASMLAEPEGRPKIRIKLPDPFDSGNNKDEGESAEEVGQDGQKLAAPVPAPSVNKPMKPLEEQQSHSKTDVGRDLPPAENGEHGACTMTPQLPVVLPEDYLCPGACPYSVKLPVGDCTKACIQGKRCAEFNPGLVFGDPITMECEPACGKDLDMKVVGCAKCSAIGVCEECLPGPFGVTGFKLSADGTQCINMFAEVMMVIYIIFGIAVVYLVYYLLLLACRPTTPAREKNLEKALAHRTSNKPTTADGSLWPFWSTSVLTDDIAGQGVMQYFTWNLWLSLVALALALGAYMAYLPGSGEEKLIDEVNGAVCGAGKHMNEIHSLVQLRDVLDVLKLASHEHWSPHQLPMSFMQQVVITDESSDVVPDQVLPKDLLSRDEADPIGKYFPVDRRMFLYLIPTYLAAFFMTIALAWWQERHTAKWVQRKGGLHFYANMVNGLGRDCTDPKALHEHVQKACPDLVGVSIAYDVNQTYGDLELLCDDWCHADRVEPDEFSREAGASAYKRQTAWIDPYLVDVGPRDHDPKPEEGLAALKGTGRAVLVFKTNQARNECARKGLPDFEGNKLEVHNLDSEPLGVLWCNFRTGGIWMNILRASGLFVAVMIGWLLLFIPYAMDIMMASNVPGQHRSALEEFVLGLFISVGNAIIAIMVEVVADWAGVRHASQRHVVVLLLGFTCVFTNTMLDILMALSAVKGATLNAAFEGGRVGYQEEFVKEMFTLIWPSYLLLPYVIAPFFTHILMYWLGVWIVRSRDCEAGAAKKALEAPPVDVVGRYYDYCNNFSISIFLLLFTAEESYQIMLFLALSMVMLFCIDRTMLLRFATIEYYTNPALARWFSRVFGIPIGFLAATTAWWGWKAGYLPHLNTPWGGEYCIPALTFIVHLACYWSLLEMGRPTTEEIPETYEEMSRRMRFAGKHFNYWNTNLALCLRVKYLKEHVPNSEHLIPFAGNKELSDRSAKGADYA